MLLNDWPGGKGRHGLPVCCSCSAGWLLAY